MYVQKRLIGDKVLKSRDMLDWQAPGQTDLMMTFAPPSFLVSTERLARCRMLYSRKSFDMP